MTAAGGTRPESLTSFLRKLPLLAGLPDAELARLAATAGRLRVPEGHVLMREGDPADALYVLLRGRLEVTRAYLGEEVVIGRHRRGAFVGEMALLGHGNRSATVRATRPSELLVIGAAHFQELLIGSPEAAVTVLRAVVERLGAMESAIVQREKLVSLGTLAAGLAHELNNPASAASAAARQLARAAAELERTTLALAASPSVAARAAELARTLSEGEGPVPATAAVRGDLEAEEVLAEWLGTLGLARPRAAASALASCGYDVARLEALAGEQRPADARALVEWLAATCDLRTLAAHVGTAAGAVHEVVSAVRAWVNLDRMAPGTVDLRQSVEATLSVLRSRLRAGIAVELDVEPGMPDVEANAGELGQVWANLIGNAVDAMDGRGTIRIRICRRGERAVVEVEDEGPGIPRALRRRVFEPFFSTKPVQSGTGLGLHVVRSIVVHRHGGRVDLLSRPGRTVFRVLLPLRQAAAGREMP
jgi:signal transduction histidine kinase